MKKVTLFIDRTLRDELVGHTWAVAYNAALVFFIKFIAFGSNPIGNSIDHGLQNKSAHAKYICRCHYESKHVVETFKSAHRIEACLTLRDKCFGLLTLEIMTYQAGEKKPRNCFNFHFKQKDGSEAGCAAILI